jgi:hypothetical protein
VAETNLSSRDQSFKGSACLATVPPELTRTLAGLTRGKFCCGSVSCSIRVAGTNLSGRGQSYKCSACLASVPPQLTRTLARLTRGHYVAGLLARLSQGHGSKRSDA